MLSPALFALRVFSFTTKQVLMMSLHSCNSIAPDDWLSPALFTLRVFSLNSCNSIKKSVIAPEELCYNLLSPALFTLRVFFYHQTSTNVVFTFMQFNKEIYFPEVSKCNVIQRYQTGKIKMSIKICFTQRCSNV